jgi:hypothetical protein
MALSPVKVHRLRRIVGWLAVLLLGFALATAALAATRGTNAQGWSLVSGAVLSPAGRPTAAGA